MTASVLPARRPALRLVESTTDVQPAWTWFCGHCGAHPARGFMPAPIHRVCESCEFGLLLQARSGSAPVADDAFLVVDSSLAVQAVSRQAERALGISEAHAVNRHVTELLIPADAEGQGPVSLPVAILRAAAGEDVPCRLFVRPSNTFGVRLQARIAACGPPRAALLVLG
jgi:hypothetical protein